jgi:hypothetical protein
MPSGWHLSMIPSSSRALRQPFLDLCQIKAHVLSELEMGDRVGGVLAAPVVDKRNGHAEQMSKFVRL